MKALFYLKLLVIMLEMAFLNVYRSINQRNDDLMALIEADLGAE